MARPIIGYWEPGDAEYLTPDEEFDKNLTLEQKLAGGYALTPEQRTILNEEQARQYLTYANVDPRTGGRIINPFTQEAMGAGPKTYNEWLERNKDALSGAGFGGKDPRFHDTHAADWGINERDPNAIMGGNPNGMSFRNIAAPTIGMIAGGLGATAFFNGLAAGAATGAGAASSSTIPGLTGLSGTGTAAGAFPLTTVAPSALEAGLFPLTTAGAGSTAGLGAIGAGASALDLSNVATQSTIPQTDYLTWQNADRLRKGLGDIKQAAPQQSQQPSGDISAPYIPYDITTPRYLQEDYLSGRDEDDLRFAAGGSIDGGLASLTAMNKGGYLDGPGDGMSDSIPATIEGGQPAALADGEYVVCSDVVSHLGNGSSKAGAKWLDGLMDNVRKARTGTTKQGKQIDPNKFLPA